MARLWSCGFELNSLASNMEFTSLNGSPSISSTTLRSGSYAGRITSLISTVFKGFFYQFSSTNGSGPYYFRTYFRYATLPSAENRMFGFESTGISNRLTISIDNTGVLRLYDGTGVIGSASSALSANTWYRIELKADLTGVAGSHIAEARLDGTIFATASNRTLSTIGAVLLGGNLLGEAQTVGDWFYDDIAINDNTGSSQTSYPGDGQIIALRPNADGDNTNWPRAGTDTGANYSQVNEIVPDDATTVVKTNIAGTIDDYNIADTPLSIGSSDTINVIHVGSRFRAETVGSNAGMKIRFKSNPSGTVSESAEFIPASLTWMTNTISVPRNYALTLYQTPDSTPLTKANLDTSQIGINLSTGNTNRIQFSNEWLLVDSTPAAGGGGGGPNPPVAPASSLMTLGVGI